MSAVVSRNDGFERRARVLPWGIEIEVWRLVETISLPTTAATLPITALFPDDDAGALPSARAGNEITLEHPFDQHRNEHPPSELEPTVEFEGRAQRHNR